MDRGTVEVYERPAATYGERRGLDDADRAAAFAAALPAGSVRVDLGCGPGIHLPLLGRPVVAADAAGAMLDLVGDHAPHALRVRCDLERLPFRRGAVAGVWSHKAHQHVGAGALPLALADLHDALAVGGRLALTAFQGDGHWVSDDDLPGRHFTLWSPGDLADLVVGAGFSVDEVVVADNPDRRGSGRIHISATRLRTLADTVAPGMRMLVCGLNPSLYATDAGVGYARPGNRFWPALRAAGLTAADRDARRLLVDDGIGLTDLVKRATVGAAELARADYRSGLDRVERLAARLRPGVVCFVGLAGWRAAVDRGAVAGLQGRTVCGAPAYVMPSTSGLNAHSTPAELADHLRAAAAHAPSNPRR